MFSHPYRLCPVGWRAVKSNVKGPSSSQRHLIEVNAASELPDHDLLFASQHAFATAQGPITGPHFRHSILNERPLSRHPALNRKGIGMCCTAPPTLHSKKTHQCCVKSRWQSAECGKSHADLGP